MATQKENVSVPEIFIPAEEAAEKIAQATYGNTNLTVREVSTNLQQETPFDWCLDVEFFTDSFNLGPLTIGKGSEKWNYQVTASKHSELGKVSAPDGPDSGSTKPAYTIWAVLNQRSLWTGSSFDELLQRIRGMN